MLHIALLPDDQESRLCLSPFFSLLRSPKRGPLIDTVHWFDSIGFHFWKEQFRTLAWGSICSNPYWFELTGVRPESNREPANNLNLLSPALFYTELWWRMHHRRFLQDPLNDMCNTASFTLESNTCVITRLAFLNLDFIDLLSFTRSLSPSTTPHRRILVVSTNLKILKLPWENLGISKKSLMIVLPFGIWAIGVTKRRVRQIIESIEVGTSLQRSESFNVRPKRMVSTRLAT